MLRACEDVSRSTTSKLISLLRDHLSLRLASLAVILLHTRQATRIFATPARQQLPSTHVFTFCFACRDDQARPVFGLRARRLGTHLGGLALWGSALCCTSTIRIIFIEHRSAESSTPRSFRGVPRRPRISSSLMTSNCFVGSNKLTLMLSTRSLVLTASRGERRRLGGEFGALFRSFFFHSSAHPSLRRCTCESKYGEFACFPEYIQRFLLHISSFAEGHLPPLSSSPSSITLTYDLSQSATTDLRDASGVAISAPLASPSSSSPTSPRSEGAAFALHKPPASCSEGKRISVSFFDYSIPVLALTMEAFHRTTLLLFKPALSPSPNLSADPFTRSLRIKPLYPE